MASTRQALDISVVIPVYNEGGAIGSLIKELRVTLGSLGRPYEIIAIDDGSTDDTPNVLQRLAGRDLKVITLRKRYGQTPALRAGFDAAQGETIITMDGDGQNDPADIPTLMEKIDSGYDCCLGWRQHRKDRLFSRRLPSRIANAMIRLIWKTDIKDFGCSLKAVRKEMLAELSVYGEMHRVLGLLLVDAGARVVSVPVNHRPRVSGRSKYGFERVLKLMLDLMTIWFLDNFNGKPIHIFGSFAVGCLGGMSLLSLTAIVQKLLYDTSLNRNPLFFGSIFLGITAIQFLSLGLLSELLTRIYFEATTRRPYLIKPKAREELVRRKAG